MNFLEKLKDKWQIESWGQFWTIMLVFALTGSASVWVGKFLRPLLGISPDTMSPFLFWPIRILLIFPVYQVLLIIVGTIFGQFNFFWAFEKKMLSRFTGRRPQQ